MLLKSTRATQYCDLRQRVAQLHQLSHILRESATAGQQCRLLRYQHQNACGRMICCSSLICWCNPHCVCSSDEQVHGGCGQQWCNKNHEREWIWECNGCLYQVATTNSTTNATFCGTAQENTSLVHCSHHAIGISRDFLLSPPTPPPWLVWVHSLWALLRVSVKVFPLVKIVSYVPWSNHVDIIGDTFFLP